ncbi:DNA methyltransferase [Bacillus coahuilensis]|uniref:DNA methyltransferase n=1 Tax=Bacillus coahuilensis TaxID=408580 RepID=UPI000AFDB7D6
MKLILQSIVGTLVSKLVRYNMGNRGNGVLNGTLYVASMVAEPDVLKVLKGKLRDLTKVLFVENYNVISGVQSTNSLQLNENSVDYIFTDPPFGANINYSELNYIWESWINLHTNTKNEAIINSKQEKGIVEYQRLLESCFKKYYEVLKSGKWMTVEFSNSKASIWNAIREAIEKAGFVIANVSALDKKQGSFKAVTTTTAVKQDLVITAYKPLQENIEKMRNHQNTPESAWVFITQHLSKLPVVMDNNESLGMIVERTPRILFDRMIAYHVQNGLPVPISSAEFQNVLAEKFSMRDGMVFLDEQVIGYDKKKSQKRVYTNELVNYG